MHASSLERTGRPWFPRRWREIDDPRHRGWVERLAELGCLDPPTALAT